MTLATRLLTLARANPGRQTSELATELGVTIRRASDAVSRLSQRGLVRSERVKVNNGTQNRVWPVDAESSFDDE